MAYRLAIVHSTIGSVSLPYMTCRGEVERDERPNPVPSRQLTVLGRPAAGDQPTALASATTQADGERILRNLYVGLIDNAALQIGELFTALSEENGLPAVFHCHAGKDRTGIVAALLLDALGVERVTGSSRTMGSQPDTAGAPTKSPLTSASSILVCPKKPPLAYWRRRDGRCSMPLKNWTVVTAALRTTY